MTKTRWDEGESYRWMAMLLFKVGKRRRRRNYNYTVAAAAEGLRERDRKIKREGP